MGRGGASLSRRVAGAKGQRRRGPGSLPDGASSTDAVQPRRRLPCPQVAGGPASDRTGRLLLGDVSVNTRRSANAGCAYDTCGLPGTNPFRAPPRPACRNRPHAASLTFPELPRAGSNRCWLGGEGDAETREGQCRLGAGPASDLLDISALPLNGGPPAGGGHLGAEQGPEGLPTLSPHPRQSEEATTLQPAPRNLPIITFPPEPTGR